jgi:flap endonuclease-1
MDTLTFKTPILLRHLTFSEQRKIPISEIDLDKVLTGLDLSYEEVLPTIQVLNLVCGFMYSSWM